MAVGLVSLPSESGIPVFGTTDNGGVHTWEKDGVIHSIQMRGAHKKKKALSANLDFNPHDFLRNQFRMIRDGEADHGAYNYQSGMEKFMARRLDEIGIPFLYEPFLLKTISPDREKPYIYLPDFVTGLKIGGKRVIIETRGVPKNSDGNHRMPASVVFEKMVSKFSNFVNAYSNEYYFVLCLDSALAYSLKKRMELNPELKVADEIWHVPDKMPHGARMNLTGKKLLGLKQRADPEIVKTGDDTPLAVSRGASKLLRDGAPA